MIEYTIGSKAKLVVVRVSGVTGFEELSQHIQRLWADPEFDPTFNTLCKMEAEAEFRMAGVNTLGTKLLESCVKRRGAVKWALVAPTEGQRTIANIVLSNMRLEPVTVRIFFDEQSALEWLQEGRSAETTFEIRELNAANPDAIGVVG